ncbi:MAG: hypothetical protein R2798_12080 [Chitinophagales bacterium]|nr:hypothetical protein [Chitinophagales bacterium]
MIKHTGYYILDPIYFEDAIANYSVNGYYHNAYLFLKNGTYLRASKKTDNKTNAIFYREDFNCDYPNRYRISNGDLILTFYTGEEWEFNEIYKKKSVDWFEKEGKILKFVSWESLT